MAKSDLDDLLRRLVEPLAVKPGRKVRLPGDFDPAHTASFVDEASAQEALDHTLRTIVRLQDRLDAQRTDALLVVLQGMDASGKDGTVKHVLSGVNPQGVIVQAFKAPSDEELRHDFLWRHQKALPERGQIGIFNRSHYEEVVTVRVHPELLARQLLPRGVRWADRYRAINAWERHLVENGVNVVKLFLNVSRAEQRRRLLARIDDGDKNWKFQASDLHERQFWGAYQQAYSAMLSKTSTEWAPWHVIPADHKWFAHLAAGAAIVRALQRIDPRYPKVGAQQRQVLEQARAQLEAES